MIIFDLFLYGSIINKVESPQINLLYVFELFAIKYVGHGKMNLDMELV